MAADLTIQLLEKKIRLIVEKVRFLQEENARLQREKTEQEEALQAGTAQVEALEKRLQLLEIAGNVSGTEEAVSGKRKELRSLLGEYIHEIDRCLARLNA